MHEIEMKCKTQNILVFADMFDINHGIARATMDNINVSHTSTSKQFITV